jgi:hypothetical protein
MAGGAGALTMSSPLRAPAAPRRRRTRRGPRLEARGDGFGLQRAGIGARLAQHQLDQHDDAENRDDEGEKITTTSCCGVLMNEVCCSCALTGSSISWYGVRN